MRRLTSYLGIALLALLLCGWGEAFAAVLCPHAAGRDHDCCPEKTESAPAEQHHHTGSHRGPARGAKSERREQASHQRAAGAVTGLSARSSSSSCAHCIGRGDSPAAPAGVRELTAQNSGAGKVAAHATARLAQPAAVSISRLTPTQHAPPGPAGRTHLLLSVFLI